MNDEPRFEASGEAQLHRGVEIVPGRDRRTGLPVRIFRFRDDVRGAPERIDHPNLPGILALERDGATTQIVTVALSGYLPLSATTLTPEQAQAFADALAALHAADIVHGGLGPERLRVADTDGHVLIEGGGAPWRAPGGRLPSTHDDVRALASMLIAKAPGLAAGQRGVLEDAAEGAGADDGVALSVALDAATDVPRTPDEGAADSGDAGAPANAGGSVVKDLPPGGVYSSGEVHPRSYKPAPLPRPEPSEPSSARWRVSRPAIVVALVATVVIWVAFGLRPQDPEPPPAPGDLGFVVTIMVGPADAPPLDIVVVSAPLASDFEAGSGLGRAPRRVQLDVPGRWVLEGRLGDRTTDAVTLTVPGTTEATLTLPSDDPDEVASP